MEFQPIEIIVTRARFLNKNSTHTQAIYILAISMLVTVFVLLPIVHITVSIQSRGIVRPLFEKTEIKMTGSGRVDRIYITQGTKVLKGDTLITLHDEDMQAQMHFARKELEITMAFLRDLQRLEEGKGEDLETTYYLGQYRMYQQEINKFETALEKAEREVARNRPLYESDLIPAQEYEEILFNQEQQEKEKNLVHSEYLNRWASDNVRYEREREELQVRFKEITEKIGYCTFIAPVDGTVEEFTGIHTGSLLQAGQTLAVISPETTKVAELWVSARDIGYLRKGELTRIQVDAFNYNLWGMLQGRIESISEDYFIADDTPVFKVRCSLEKEFLEMKNGVKGPIRKGMTVNARFIVARRSLLQLLYEKTDDWLNPSRSLVAQSRQL